MIVWQGFGFLAALIPVILLVLMGGLDKSNTMTHGIEAALIISAVIVWFVGKKLNSKPGKVLIDPETNEEVEFKTKHTMFWMPMEWFGPILAVLGLYTLVKSFV